jgi:hypothetical protein
MLHLNPRQYETLYNLVEGNGKPVDRRSVRALQNRRLVNKEGCATTSGWHAVGRLRFCPVVETPRLIDIANYRGLSIGVCEGPRLTFNDDFNHRSDTLTFTFDVERLLKWYHGICCARQQFINDMWRRALDYEMEHESLYPGYILSLERDATDYALREDEGYYTNHIFFEIARRLATHDMSMASRGTTSNTSFKYSLQDNTDELERFLVSDPDQYTMKFMWTVDVD